jgi:hypothetical protein
MSRFPGFSPPPRQFDRKTDPDGRSAPEVSSEKAADRAAGFYYLLCMIKGFAFAWPLCGWIKET